METIDLTLPSGRVIQARRPGVMQLAIWETLPFDLPAAVSGRGGDTGPGREALEFLSKTRDLVVYCFVAPRVSASPKAGEISPLEISDEDLTFVVRWARRIDEAAALQAFRGGRADGSAGGDGAGVGSAAEPTGGRDRSGSGA